MNQFDLIVVGGGAGGLVTAVGAAGIGARVALVERGRLGGECLWNGCVPSKALLACGKAAAHARRALKFGVHAEPQVDFGAAMRWVHGAVATIAPHDSADRFRGMGIDVIQGTARFTGERLLDVDGRRIAARHVVIATGSRPVVPPIPGLDATPYLTNETVFELAERPAHLIVLGGGAIGVELAQAFARLGSVVTVVEGGPALLAREDEQLVPHLRRAIEEDGVDFLLGTRAVGSRATATGIALTVRLPDGATRELEGSHLLVAVGREARTDTMELAVGGVRVGANGVVVDDMLRTTAKNVWAVGDCTGGPRFTHVADYQARLVIRNAFFPWRTKVSYGAIPWVTYTDPELAHVGLTEREAREAHGRDVRVWTRDVADVDRAIADGERTGMVKLITRANGALLGGHILCAGAGQMIGEVALALKTGLGVQALAGLVHPYPTLSEAIRQAAEGHQKARFTGATRSIARWIVRRSFA